MNNRQWSILTVLILVNYIVFSSLITFVMESNKPAPTPTRTPLPTFTVTRTSTPTLPPPTPSATLVFPPTSTPTPVPPPPTDTPLPPPSTDTPAPPPPRTERTIHVVQAGESLSVIAAYYGVSVNSIQWLNGLTNASVIHPGQELIIPASGEVIPSPTPGQEVPSPTPAPPPAEEGGEPPPEEAAPPEPPAEQHQFSGKIERWWPNCGLAAVGKSKVLDANSGEPVNGLRIRIWNDGYEALSLVSGVGHSYGAGEYDIVLNNHPIDAKFYLAVWDWETAPGQYTRVDSDVITLEFNSGDCQPEGEGHQVAIVNWYRHW